MHLNLNLNAAVPVTRPCCATDTSLRCSARPLSLVPLCPCAVSAFVRHQCASVNRAGRAGQCSSPWNLCTSTSGQGGSCVGQGGAALRCGWPTEMVSIFLIPVFRPCLPCLALPSAQRPTVALRLHRRHMPRTLPRGYLVVPSRHFPAKQQQQQSSGSELPFFRLLWP